MDPITVTPVPCIHGAACLPIFSAILLGVPKDLGLNDIGNMVPGEPKGVYAKSSGCTRRSKVMGFMLDRFNFRCP